MALLVSKETQFGSNKSSSQDTDCTYVKTERRKAKRFPLAIELAYKTTKLREQPIAGRGLTLNISSSGVLFTSEHEIPLGARLEICIRWPVPLNENCSLNLIASGPVMRRAEGQLAIEIMHHEFRTRRSIKSYNVHFQHRDPGFVPDSDAANTHRLGETSTRSGSTGSPVEQIQTGRDSPVRKRSSPLFPKIGSNFLEQGFRASNDMAHLANQSLKGISHAPLNVQAFPTDSGIPSWNPIRLRDYLKKREGKIWNRQNTLMLLQRANELDCLIEQLMRSAGVKIEPEH